MKQIFGFNLHIFVNKEIKDLIKITFTPFTWNFVYVNFVKWGEGMVAFLYFKLQYNFF